VGVFLFWEETLMRKFRRLFSKVEDSRAPNAQHKLLEILFIGLSATLCGAQHCTEFAQFGRSKEALLRRVLDLEHGIPSHDTFSTVFRALHPDALATALGKFTKAFNRGLGRYRTIAIDGKALRGAYRRGERCTPLHMVNVWACEARMALAQRKAPQRNEIAGALEVLALLDLDSAIVTADALHSSPAMAQAILDRQGHYVLALKKNRAKLFTAAEACLKAPRGASRTRQRSTLAHGRRERRAAVVVPAADMAAPYRFPGLKAVGRIDSWRRTDADPAKHKARYFLLSRKLSAAQLLKIARAHWGVENNLHWILDVVFAEDRCRTRMDHAPENLALLRKLAINMLQASPYLASMRRKVLHAAWNDDFLLSLFGHMR
jgi:predicted transposase YbfD/YdcC